MEPPRNPKTRAISFWERKGQLVTAPLRLKRTDKSNHQPIRIKKMRIVQVVCCHKCRARTRRSRKCQTVPSFPKTALWTSRTRQLAPVWPTQASPSTGLARATSKASSARGRTNPSSCTSNRLMASVHTWSRAGIRHSELKMAASRPRICRPLREQRRAMARSAPGRSSVTSQRQASSGPTTPQATSGRSSCRSSTSVASPRTTTPSSRPTTKKRSTPRRQPSRQSMAHPLLSRLTRPSRRSRPRPSSRCSRQ